MTLLHVHVIRARAARGKGLRSRAAKARKAALGRPASRPAPTDDRQESTR